MFISESRNPFGVGILAFQHEGYLQNDPAYPLENRTSILGVRVTSRKVKGLQASGHYRYDPESVGDLIGGMLWKPNPEDSSIARTIPSWRFSYPSIVTQKSAPAGTSAGAGKFKARPIRRDDYLPDERMENKEFAASPLMELTGSELLVDTLGIAMAGMEENEQEDLFFPLGGGAGSSLLAPHRVQSPTNGPQFGTLVFDLRDTGEVDDAGVSILAPDPARSARLQTTWRVVIPTSFICGEVVVPTGDPDAEPPVFPTGTLAWNLAPTGLTGTQELAAGMGLIIDRPQTGGTGQLVNLLTLGATSHTASGPFGPGFGEFDKHFVGKTIDGQTINSTHLDHLSYFAKTAALDGPFDFESLIPLTISHGFIGRFSHIAFDGDLPYNHCSANLKGKWRIWNECVALDVIDTPEKPGPPIDSSADGFSEENPFAPNRNIRQWRPDQGPVNFLVMPQALALPTIMGRAQDLTECEYDGRFATRGNIGIVKKTIETSPITFLAEAFGTQGGVDGSGNNYSFTGRWSYTVDPRNGKFLGGTSSGGLAIMPPEVDMVDRVDDFAPVGQILSTTTWLTVPGAFWGAGLPDTVQGIGIHTGHRWGESAGTLTYQRASDDSAAITLTDTFSLDVDGTTRVHERFAWDPTTPPTITADQNDFDVGNSTFIRLSSTGDNDITGFANGTKGRFTVILNLGPGSLTLKHQNVGSLAVNRIIESSGLDAQIRPDGMLRLIYDDTTARWRIIP